MSKIIVTLWGCSGVGKTTLARYLVHHSSYHQLKTFTTRPKRTPQESDYNFVSPKQFRQLSIFAGTCFAGHYYGSSLLNLRHAFQISPRQVIILTWSGVEAYVRQFRSTQIQVYPIEVYMPLGSILKYLHQRSDNHLTGVTLHRRLESYRLQCHTARKSSINSFVVNHYPDAYQNLARQVKMITEGENQ